MYEIFINYLHLYASEALAAIIAIGSESEFVS
jgi:hypothetical protein